MRRELGALIKGGKTLGVRFSTLTGTVFEFKGYHQGARRDAAVESYSVQISEVLVGLQLVFSKPEGPLNPLPHGVLATFSLTAGGLLRPPEEGDISREKTILMTSLQVL
jgi:hypothetical protein